MQDQCVVANITNYSDQNTPYLYATPNPLLAMTYTMPKGVRTANCHGLFGTELLFIDKESIIGDPELLGGMYSFNSHQFLQAHLDGVPTDQWVSSEHVDISKAEFIRVQSINDIMRSGVQVFQISDDYDAYAFSLDEPADSSESSMIHHYAQLVETGKLRWLNEERCINRKPCLSKNEGDDNSVALFSMISPPVLSR
ncbi:hypothetical protein PS691_00986 [Pseudomonas fluorescens]|uniref:Uncharacterized protein n=2 Tax=Pseudomonas fluorescens TaxID=294 RepID=A0A5E7ASQ7_PSEFL|nr:hypothetical protein PS691_00986 [Pseudomonas fluorescens]